MASIHYTSEDGLPSSEIYDLLQDRQGYIWIATDNGVSRFNGYEFENFDPTDGLVESSVFALYEDSQGDIWASTLSGDIYIHKQDTFVPFQYNHLLNVKTVEAFSIIRYFLVDKDGVFHGAIPDHGILQIYPDGTSKLVRGPVGSFQVIGYQKEGKILPCRIMRRTKDEAERKEIYRNRRFFWFKEDSLMGDIPFESSMLAQNQKPHCNTQELPDGSLLFAYVDCLHHIQDGRLKLTVPFKDPLNIMAKGPSGRIYLGLESISNGGGLQIYQGYDDFLRGRSEMFFPDLTISAVLEDRAGGLWVGTNEDGLFYIANPKVRVYDQMAGFSTDYTTAISPAGTDEVFVGSKDGGCYHLDIGNDQLTVLPKPYTEVWDMAYDFDSSTLLIGGGGTNELYKWQNNAMSSINFPSSIKKLAIDPNGELFGVLPGAQGFTHYNWQEEKTLFITTYFNSPLRNWTMAVHRSMDGRVWVGQEDGLYEFRDSTLLPADQKHPAFRWRIEEIKELPDSTLVIGTKGGGVLFWRGNDIQQLNEQNGLTTNMVEKIHIDSAQNIWVGTLNGMDRVRRRANGQFEIEHYSTVDGLPSSEVTDIASWGKDVWVATTKGLMNFRPNDQIVHYDISPPILSHLLLNNEPIDLGQTNSWPYWKSNLQFEYFAIDFQQNAKINYRHRLQPTDDWIRTDLTSLGFAALAPGNYTFEIQAATKYGRWSESTVYAFDIRPPFYKTGIFALLCMLLMGGTFYALYQRRIQNIRQKVELELQIQKMKSSALQAQMSPHFIFNRLHSIQGYIAEKDHQTAISYLGHISNLIRAVLQASSTQSISLEEEVAMLTSYMELENYRLEHPFQYDIIVDPRLDPVDCQIPPMLIQPLVENAIIHGVSKLKKGKGVILIEFQLVKKDLISVRVRDNGNGMKESSSKAANGVQGATSLGMYITRQRLEMQNLQMKQGYLLRVRNMEKETDGRKGVEAEVLVKCV
ncbi:MAG: two-component regulator propeller domain-containing protein [Bacteroidota bacterium]